MLFTIVYFDLVLFFYDGAGWPKGRVSDFESRGPLRLILTGSHPAMSLC